MAATARPSDASTDWSLPPALDGLARALVEENPPPIALLDGDFQLRWLSPALAALLRLDPETSVGRPWQACHPPSWALLEPLLDASHGTRIAAEGEEFVLRAIDQGSPGRRPSLWLLQANATRRRGDGARSDAHPQHAYPFEYRPEQEIFRWIDRAPGFSRFDGQPGMQGFFDALEAVHPSDIERVRESYGLLGAGSRGRIEVRYRLRSQSGAWLWMVERARLTDEGPNAGAIQGILTELDSSIDIEEELANARERLRLALECAQVGFFVWDLASDQAAGLEDWCATIGLPAQAAAGFGSNWLDRVHQDDRSAVLGARRNHFAGLDEIYECEYRVRAPGGSEVWVMERAEITRRAASGEPLQVAGILMDVSRRKRIESDLERSESRLSAAVWAGGLGLYEFDMRTHGTRWFSRWLEQNGFAAPGQDIDMYAWEHLMHPEDRASIRQSFRRFLGGELPEIELEYRARRQDGSWRWLLSVTRSLEADSAGRPVRLIGLLTDIHERKEAELAVSRREFVYRTVNQLTPGYVGEFEIEDGQIRFTWVSEGFEEIYGRTPQEIERIGWLNVCAPSSREAVIERTERLLAGERTFGDSEIVRADGSYRWLRTAASPALDATTRGVKRWWALVQDITSQKLAEQALRASEQRLRLVAEQSPDWLLLIDCDYRLIHVNKPMFGLPPEMLVGRSVFEIGPDKKLEQLRDLLERTSRDEEVVGFAHSSVPEFPPARDMFTRVRAIRSEGVLIGYIITTSDVTDLRSQQRMLRLQADILETMREGVVLLDHNGAIRFSNPAFRRLVHAGPDDAPLEGQPFLSILRVARGQPSGGDLPFADVERAQGQPTEVEFRRRDGTRFTGECVARPMQIDDRGHWLFAITDVTNRKILERQILAISNREQQRIGNDLHDGLGQELTGVALLMRAHLSRLAKQAPDSLPEGEEVMSVVARTIESTRALARGLSPVSRKGGGLAGALRDLAHRAQVQSGRSVTLRTRMTAQLALDDGAADHLFRIAQEALNNALKHGHAREVRILLAATVRNVRLSIRDDGRGLAPGHEDARGLGLRTMRYRAESIGGRLSIRNHPLGGVAVRCVCPRNARAVG